MSGVRDPDRSPPDEFEVVGREICLRCPNGVARTKLSNAYFDSKLATRTVVRRLGEEEVRVMSQILVTTFLSLDGVMQAPGGPDEDRSGGFDHGGWLVPFADEDMMRLVVDWIGRADGFLLGRKTYEIFAAHWPRVTDPDDLVARALNTLPKYVASKTLHKVEWNNSTLIPGNVVEEITNLKRRPGKELQVHGSGGLAQTLIENDLVDEYRLWSFPVILGRGKRLFGAGTVPATLKLVDSETTSTGVAIHTYRRAGDMQYGSVEATEWREVFGRRSEPAEPKE
jgi:dihydrofolate reductase